MDRHVAPFEQTIYLYIRREHVNHYTPDTVSYDMKKKMISPLILQTCDVVSSYSLKLFVN